MSCRPLETCCFLKLVNEFATYPTEFLALLPTKFRYRLIQSLPAVDVCQLEQSSFVVGLDMEKVWATHRLQWKGLLPSNITTTSGNKDAYFSGVCKTLLDHQQHYCVNILKFLFSCFGIFDNQGLFVDQHTIPTRYYSYFANSEGFSDAQLLALVFKTSHYYPKSLHCDRYVAFQHWERTESYSLLSAYLGEICNLHLSYSMDIDYAVLNFILHVISKRKLSCVVIENTNDELLEKTLLALRPLLIGAHSQLKTFKILHHFPSNISNVTASEISRVLVANQTSLHTIELTPLPLPPYLYRCLSSFFKHPHLRLLHLSTTPRLASLQEVLYAFMTTPRSSRSGELCLHIQDFPFKSTSQDMSGFTRNLSCLSLPEENHNKSLVLSFAHVQVPHPLITWLQEHVLLHLKKLELSLEIAHYFLHHQRMEVEELSLKGSYMVTFSSSKLYKSLETPGCFDDILGNECLKRFRFSFRYPQEQLTSEILLNLARGLHEQAKVGNLEELDLSRNSLGSASNLEAEVILLFEAIFSLPQLEKLTLVLNDNFVDLKMLERLWVEKGGKQLKKLSVTGLGSCRHITVQTMQRIKIIAKELIFN